MLKHLEKQLVPYLEGRLSEDDARQVEEHLKECPECRAESEELIDIIHTLAKNKNLFCPLSSEIYDYAAKGTDPNDAVASHLKECETCRAEYSQYCKTIGNESLPDELWHAIKSRLDAEPVIVSPENTDTTYKEPFIEKLIHWIRPRVTIPALVAAIVLLVFLYQEGVHRDMVGLTSVAWENLPQPKDGTNGHRRDLLFVIVFEGFKQPLPQNKIDSLYRAITPDIDVLNRYRVVSPAQVSSVIKESRQTVASSRDVFRVLAGRWKNGLALVITITPSSMGFVMNAKLQDLLLDRELGTVHTKDVPFKDMEESMRKLVREAIS